jgi:hypothetical protein
MFTVLLLTTLIAVSIMVVIVISVYGLEGHNSKEASDYDAVFSASTPPTRYDPPASPVPCNSGALAMERATDDMNVAYRARGFFGPTAYWAALAHSQHTCIGDPMNCGGANWKSEGTMLGEAWATLVETYKVDFDRQCFAR